MRTGYPKQEYLARKDLMDAGVPLEVVPVIHILQDESSMDLSEKVSEQYAEGYRAAFREAIQSIIDYYEPESI